MTEVFDNATSPGASTYVTAQINPGDDHINVRGPASPALQGGNFRIIVINPIDSSRELMMVTSGQDSTVWAVTRGIEGTVPLGFPALAIVKHIFTAGSMSAAVRRSLWLPSSAIDSNVSPVSSLANASALSSGRLTVAGGLTVLAGRKVTGIRFFSGGTGLSGGSNQWFILLDQLGNIISKTTDDGATAWAANSPKSLNLSGSWTPAVDTAVYLGINVVATTVPTLICVGISTVIGGRTPMIAATANTGLTNPASFVTLGALAALANLPYAEIY